MSDPNLFQPWFRDRKSWASWFAFLKALFRLQMTPAESKTFRNCTGRKTSPLDPHEAWLVCGRRSGKSSILSLIAVYLAVFVDWRPYLARGEVGTIILVAVDRSQAKVIFDYVMSFFREIPMLKDLVKREMADSLELQNGITIQVSTANFRSIRGRTVVAALLDEVAFWRGENTASPDAEVMNAIRPSMATIPGSFLIGSSSPYARRGILWEAYRAHYGHDSDVFVWQAGTRTMNPTVPQAFIDKAIAKDPAVAGAEYLAEFRTDVESFVKREVIDACTVKGRHEVSPDSAHHYVGFVDPSGGSRDSFSLAISHKCDDGRVILDLIREVVPPFSPTTVIERFARILKRYRITAVQGDRYAGEFPREMFRKCGVEYLPCKRAKSQLYRDFLPALNSRRVELLDHERLTDQLQALERRTTRGGHDVIDHPTGCHDDVVNAVAGAVVLFDDSQPCDLWTVRGGERTYEATQHELLNAGWHSIV